jgi:hypothetical protein
LREDRECSIRVAPAEQVCAFRGRGLAATSNPHVFVDATYCKLG